MAASLGATTKTKMMVFIDANVIISYIEGKPELAKLFSPEIEANVQYAINPVVLQELLLLGSPFPESVDIDRLSSKFVMLPVDLIDSKQFLEKTRTLSKKLSHINNVIILASAKNCDYILSYDVELRDLSLATDATVLNPEEFLAQMERG